MANYSTLKTAVQDIVKTNGNNEITGALLQQSLIAIINSLGAKYQFAGIAHEDTDPGTPDYNVAYLAGPGTYPNFNAAVVNDGELGILKYAGSWSIEKVLVGQNYTEQLTELSNRILAINAANEIRGSKISIIGDSISSYSGTDLGNSYYPTNYPPADVNSVFATWWKKLIVSANGELGINASFGGARVTNTKPQSPNLSFYERVSLLNGNGTPDVIFVALGTNDSSYSIALGTYDYDAAISSYDESQFIPAYIKGVRGLMEAYPNAKIYLFAFKMSSAYRTAIKNIAEHYNLPYIEIQDYPVCSDGPLVHPDNAGMNLIAERAMKHKLYSLVDQATQQVSAVSDDVNGLVIDVRRPVLNFPQNTSIYFNISSLTVGRTYLARVVFNSEHNRQIALSTGTSYSSVTTIIKSLQNFPAGTYYFTFTPNGETYLRIGDTSGNYPAAALVIADASIAPTMYNEIDELNAKVAPVSEIITDIPNTDSNYTISSYTIATTGAYTGNSNYRTIWFKCKPNTTYTIKNPYGGVLRVGSSVNAVVSPFQRFAVSDDPTTLTYKTGTEDNRLYVCFWVNSSSATVGDAFQALEITSKTANDEYAREKVASALKNAASISKNLYNPKNHFLAGMNMPTSGVPTGTYADRCMLGLIPVHGLSKISVALISPSTASGSTRYCWYGSNKSPLTGGAIGGSPTYGETNNVVLDVPADAYYFGCLVYYANMELDANGAPKAMIQAGDVYTGYVPFDETIVGVEANRPKDVYIVAKNSPRKYRYGADYYCTGTNDELVLQQALNAVGENGTLYLAPGTYNIDSFPLQSDGQYCAIQYQTNPQTRVKIKAFDQTPMRENGYSQINHCAVLRVRQTCYNNLDANTNYSVIGVNAPNGERVWNGACFDIEGVGIMIPGNQKNIIAFDAYFAFCMMMFKCMATAIPTNAMPSVAGVDGCVGIRCTKGSNFGQESQINTCAMYGFGQGIAVMGEHYVITNAKTIYNKYGFTFNWYGSTDGGYSHPNTLINCCSEMDFNYPYFGQTTQRQSLTLIDFNMEHRAAAFALGGNRATEATPGSWRGTINYTIKVYGTDGYNITGNSVELPFWADGCGRNVESTNDAQAKNVTSATLATYAPNMNQIVWCTDLNKHLICTNPETKEWRDFAGNVVTL